MRNYCYKSIDQRDYEKGLMDKTNPVLISNFNKVAEWIKKNCPNLNGKFGCSHNPYYWLTLVVEDGKAYLEYGSHGYSFEIALSTTETATKSTGSCQSVPYAFNGVQFFRDDRLEQFLKEWKEIKPRVINENSLQRNVFSEDFNP